MTKQFGSDWRLVNISVNKKGNIIFLWVGLALIAFSVIYFSIFLIIVYRQISIDYANDTRAVLDEFVYVLFVVLFFLVPLLALEGSWLRGGYKMLKYKPKGLVRIMYIISVSLSFLAIILQWLIFTHCIDLKNYDYNFIQEVLLWTGWPVAILSFILSSIRSKEEVASKCSDDDSKKGE